MLKSEIYRVAQEAVLNSPFTNEVRLEVLKKLMKDEELALFVEQQKEGDNQ